jgi:hypothetical protein
VNPAEDPRELIAPDPQGPLADFLLRAEPASEVFSPELDRGGPQPTVPLAKRLTAATADVAAVGLIVALALLAARSGVGHPPRLAGLIWVLLFTVYLSFFAVVPPLVVFGRTIGMALTGLSARGEAAGRGLTPGEAVRRWLGSLATVATAGLLLALTRADPATPTPADRFSGRPLIRDESA